MITPDKMKLLEQPFRLDEHNFLEGNPYILKEAIRKRLSQVDPRWTNTKPELMAHDGDVVILTGGLTIAGDTRYAIGTGLIQSTRKDKKTGEIFDVVGFNLAREYAKAYKSAQSDLLPRCALEFNIGAYLKHKPKNVNQENFGGWLAQITADSHWARNGAGEQFKELMLSLNLTWEQIAGQIEPDRILKRLSDTHLTAAQAIDRLHQIAAGG